MCQRRLAPMIVAMPRFVLHHRHAPSECASSYAAWKGFPSPLRHRPAASSCVDGGHEVWWIVVADGPDAALELLPPYVARRTGVIPIREVKIP
jgi:hypothetical protein